MDGDQSGRTERKRSRSGVVTNGDILIMQSGYERGVQDYLE